MVNYFGQATILNAIHDYATCMNVSYFTYEGMKGFQALCFYCTRHPEFELEVVCAYMDMVLFGDVVYPPLPQVV
jgi:hypothetical protein